MTDPSPQPQDTPGRAPAAPTGSGSGSGSDDALALARRLVDRLVDQLTIGGPPLGWTLRGYKREGVRGDLIAGVTVAALIVPLSIGYAQVAGLPPEAGLYASLLPLLAYAVFGSSRRLIVGPDAATAALVGAAIAPLAVASAERMQLASALALLVALIFAGMRLASLGFLANFLSRPILVGYMTGVGISVALGQIPKILGASPFQDVLAVLARTDFTGVGPGVVLQSVAVALSQVSISWPSVVVGLLVLAVVLAGDRLLPGVPIALPALVVALLASVLLDLPARGVQVLGPVPSGLPPIALPLVTIEDAIALLPGAIGIAVLSFADTVATGRTFAHRDEETDANRELVALSAADLGASLTSGYPISSSPSRTASGEAAGSRTQLTGIVAAGGVALTLLFLAPYLAELPIPALGAVILTAVIRFISIDRILRIWRVQKVEGAIAIAAALGVILYGTLVGVGVAVGLAALNVFRRAARPAIAELGRLPGTDVFADLERSPAARRVPGVAVVRFSGPLFFATTQALRDRVRALLEERPDIRVIGLDAAGIVDLDLTAAGAVDELDRELAERGVQLLIARPNGALRDLLRRYGLGRLVGGEDEVRRTVTAALASASLAKTDEERAQTASAVATTPPIEPEAAEGGFGTEAGEALVPSGGGEVPAEAGATQAPSLGPEPPQRRWTAGVVIVGAAAIGGMLVVSLLVGAGDTGPKPPTGEVVVPNLIGLPLDRAREATEARGLVLSDPIYVQTTAQPEDTVVGQTPQAGEVAAAGAIVVPSVSTGRELVAIPDVAGMPQSDAIVTLTTAGLRVAATVQVEDVTVPRGSVVSTSPPAGLQVSTGTSITLAVSSGPPPQPSPSAAPSLEPSAEPSATPAPSPSVEPTPPPSAGSSASPVPSTSGEPSPEPSSGRIGGPSPVPSP